MRASILSPTRNGCAHLDKRASTLSPTRNGCDGIDNPARPAGAQGLLPPQAPQGTLPFLTPRLPAVFANCVTNTDIAPSRMLMGRANGTPWYEGVRGPEVSAGVCSMDAGMSAVSTREERMPVVGGMSVAPPYKKWLMLLNGQFVMLHR